MKSDPVPPTRYSLYGGTEKPPFILVEVEGCRLTLNYPESRIARMVWRFLGFRWSRA